MGEGASPFPHPLSPAEAVRAEVSLVVGDGCSARRRYRIQTLVVVLVEGDLDGAQVVFQLLHRARSDYGARNPRFVLAPRDCDLTRSAALLVCYGLHGIENFEGLIREVVAAEAPRFQAVAAVFGGLALVAGVFAGEETTGEGGPGDQGRPVGLRERNQLALDAPVEQMVRGLLGDEAVQSEFSGGPQGFHQLPGGIGGGADVAHFSGPDQVVQGTQRLVYRHLGTRAVDLVQVYVVDAETPKRRLTLLDDVPAVVARGVGIFVVHRHVYLGREHDSVALAIPF